MRDLTSTYLKHSKAGYLLPVILLVTLAGIAPLVGPSQVEAEYPVYGGGSPSQPR